MADPLNLEGLKGLDPANPMICTVEASCVTGFEPMALEEIQEKLNSTGNLHRGRVVFDISLEQLASVLQLRTVNNCWVIIGHTHQLGYPDTTTEEQLGLLAAFAENQPDWSKGLRAWHRLFHWPGGEDQLLASSPPQEEGVVVPTFRCTCYRSGTNHKYKSTEAAFTVGGRIQEKFKWTPKMKNYDIEVVLNCDIDQVYIGIAMNNTSLVNRTVSHLGPTSLRPTICAALVRLARVQPGDVVLDPMCGGASIPLEGCQMDTHAFYLGAEIHEKAVSRTAANIRGLAAKVGLPRDRAVDGLQWDAVLAPCLRDGCVDVIVTDLPFGKRSGSKADNRVLYPRTLLAMARLVRPNTGRAVLLTQDKNSMFRSLGQVSQFWKLQKSFSCNIGGLAALVFMFNRTGATTT